MNNELLLTMTSSQRRIQTEVNSSWCLGNASLTFQRIILIRILKPDALIASVRAFIEQLMGEKFVSSGDINLKEMYEESTAKTPLIFILSSGKWKHVYAMRMVDSA